MKLDVPPISTIDLLQPIQASPTEMPAKYTVLKRSQYFASCLALDEVDTVFDQA